MQAELAATGPTANRLEWEISSAPVEYAVGCRGDGGAGTGDP